MGSIEEERWSKRIIRKGRIEEVKEGRRRQRRGGEACTHVLTPFIPPTHLAWCSPVPGTSSREVPAH